MIYMQNIDKKKKDRQNSQTTKDRKSLTDVR